MQNVSTRWKEVLGCYDTPDRPPILPISYVELEYTVTDPETRGKETASDNGHSDWSNVSETVSHQDTNYFKHICLEQNSWLLDGTGVFFENLIDNNWGYVSEELSSENYTFANPPKIIITFDKVYMRDIPGVTVKWSSAFEEMANSFTVKVYNGQSLVLEHTVSDNTNVLAIAETNIVGYDRIEVDIDKWCLPYCRARVEEIVAGIITVFDKKSLISVTFSDNADPVTFKLPERKVAFDIVNADEKWNPDNPEGATKYLIEQQEITARAGYKIDGKIEWIPMGMFYMSEWATPSNGVTASFVATGLLDFMNSTIAVEAGTSISLGDLCEKAFTQSNLPLGSDGNVLWEISEDLYTKTVVIPDDFDYTCSEVLQLCANAGQCIIVLTRRGKILIKHLDSVKSDYVIDRFVSYANAEFELTKPLSKVIVNDDMGEAVNSETGEMQKVRNDLIQSPEEALSVAEWVKSNMIVRKHLNGSFRPDPRIDCFDIVEVRNKYATSDVLIESITLEYNGAFRGSYEGRVVSQ